MIDIKFVLCTIDFCYKDYASLFISRLSCLSKSFMDVHLLSSIGWTKIETIDSLMRKAGYDGPVNEALRKKLRITRYQSTLYTMHYNDYVSYVKTIRGAAPVIVGVKSTH